MTCLIIHYLSIPRYVRLEVSMKRRPSTFFFFFQCCAKGIICQVCSKNIVELFSSESLCAWFMCMHAFVCPKRALARFIDSGIPVRVSPPKQQVSVECHIMSNKQKETTGVRALWKNMWLIILNYKFLVLGS